MTSIFGIKITFFNFGGKLIHQMLLTLSITHLSIFDAIYSSFTTEQGQFALKYILNVNLTDPAQYFFLEWQFYWLNAGTHVHMYIHK